jgi:drug/metabolite transporter (DMT)-like permease
MFRLIFYIATVAALADDVAGDDVAFFQESVNVHAQSLLERNKEALTLALDVQEGEDEIEERVEAAQNIVLLTLDSGRQLMREKLNTAAKMNKMMKQLAIPVIAIIVGAVCCFIFSAGRGPLCSIFGKVLVNFGIMTFMNLYMKAVFSEVVVSEEHHYKGFPATFAVTGIQQITSVAAFVVFMGFSRLTPWTYRPQKLTKSSEIMLVLVLSLSFTLNIALNNFSLMLLPISVNLMIRSCAPLSTAAMQWIVGKVTKSAAKEHKPVEIFLMCVGICCAVIAVLAKAQSRSQGLLGDGNDAGFALGVIVCVLGTVAASMNLSIADYLGNIRLTALDVVFYMAAPAFIFLLIPSFCIPHESSWPGGSRTDWAIIKEVAHYSPGAIGLAFLSGVFALFSNWIQFYLSQSISATFTAFAGTSNKAATILLAVLVKLEAFPKGAAGTIMLLAVIGNLLTFCAYSMHAAGKSSGTTTSTGKAKADR